MRKRRGRIWATWVLFIGERVNGVASTCANLASVYLQTDCVEKAKPLLAWAYLVFTRMGSPNAEWAFQELVGACGSVDAANAYLESVATDQE
jgi:hypothetical protein